MIWSQKLPRKREWMSYDLLLVEAQGGGAVRVGVVLPGFNPIWLGDVPILAGGTAAQAKARGMRVATWAEECPDELAQLVQVATGQGDGMADRALAMISDAERGWPVKVTPGDMFDGLDLWVFMFCEQTGQAFQTTPLESGTGLFSTRLRWSSGGFQVETLIPEMDLPRMANDLLTGKGRSALPARIRARLKEQGGLAAVTSDLVFHTLNDPEYQSMSMAPAVHEARATTYVQLISEALPTEYTTAAVLVKARVKDALRVMRGQLALING